MMQNSELEWTNRLSSEVTVRIFKGHAFYPKKKFQHDLFFFRKDLGG